MYLPFSNILLQDCVGIQKIPAKNRTARNWRSQKSAFEINPLVNWKQLTMILFRYLFFIYFGKCFSQYERAEKNSSSRISRKYFATCKSKISLTCYTKWLTDRRLLKRKFADFCSVIFPHMTCSLLSLTQSESRMKIAARKNFSQIALEFLSRGKKEAAVSSRDASREQRFWRTFYFPWLNSY